MSAPTMSPVDIRAYNASVRLQLASRDARDQRTLRLMRAGLLDWQCAVNAILTNAGYQSGESGVLGAADMARVEDVFERGETPAHFAASVLGPPCAQCAAGPCSDCRAAYARTQTRLAQAVTP